MDDGVVYLIGGPQGSGVDTAANIFNRACGYGGYHVYGKREYHSNIKGLHSYFLTRISRQKIRADRDRVSLLASFESETFLRHIFEVAPGGYAIYNLDEETKLIDSIQTISPHDRASINRNMMELEINPKTIKELADAVSKRGVNIIPLSYKEILSDVAKKTSMESGKVSRVVNVVAVGFSFAMMEYDIEVVKKAIRSVFGKKEISDLNERAVEVVYEYYQKNKGSYPHVAIKLEPVEVKEKRVLLTGFQSVALGKIAGGCRLQTYYPITPAADESEFLEANEVFEGGSMVVFQAEDEIAAINMATSAALTGARTATSTSGPGFSLKVEGLGWAGMNEVPVVVTLYQRGGPSTGLPTRHGQDELKFALYGGHGEFPRIVIASGDIEECFYDTIRALNYAEEFQTPVIHLVDKALANSTESINYLDTSIVKIERGKFTKTAPAGYKRFEFSEDGISYRVPVGSEGTHYWLSGEEHDEVGHMIEESDIRIKMHDKRMRKLITADRTIPLEERISVYGGDGDVFATVVSWGSTKGACIEAIERLKSEGYKINFVQVRVIQPLPGDPLRRILERAKIRIALEGNYSAQLAGFITEKTGIKFDYFIVKFNGRAVNVDETYQALKNVITGRAPQRQVLTDGI